MPRAPVPLSSALREFQLQFEAKIASLDLAEKWDNVGFLVESPRSTAYMRLRVLACIDLTKKVADEAIKKKCNLILSYHPVLFRPTQSLALSNKSAVLACLDAGVSIFSPHTSLDSAENGMNDFLCDIFSSNQDRRRGVKTDPTSGVKVGRIVEFPEPMKLRDVLLNLKTFLSVDSVRYAGPDCDQEVRSVAVCVGSGSSVLMGAEADVYLTGEMSHHEILACVGLGKAVVLLDHSSSERPFLPELARRVRKLTMVEEVLVSEEDVEPIRVFR